MLAFMNLSGKRVERIGEAIVLKEGFMFLLRPQWTWTKRYFVLFETIGVNKIRKCEKVRCRLNGSVF